jgi:hypothetical protein
MDEVVAAHARVLAAIGACAGLPAARTFRPARNVVVNDTASEMLFEALRVDRGTKIGGRKRCSQGPEMQKAPPNAPTPRKEPRRSTGPLRAVSIVSN